MKQDLLCTVQQKKVQGCGCFIIQVCLSVRVYVFILSSLTSSAVMCSHMFACLLMLDVFVMQFFSLSDQSLSEDCDLFFARNNQVKGFYFVPVPGVIFLKVVCVCVCARRLRECPLHLFIRMFPIGLAVMRPAEQRSDGVELIITAERREGGKTVRNKNKYINYKRILDCICENNDFYYFPFFVKTSVNIFLNVHFPAALQQQLKFHLERLAHLLSSRGNGFTTCLPLEH